MDDASRFGWPAVACGPALIKVGATDDYCYNIIKDPVHVHDLEATILHCLGIDHKRLTYKVQGREFRLTDVAEQERRWHRVSVECKPAGGDAPLPSENR
jgi:hypothetical protein